MTTTTQLDGATVTEKRSEFSVEYTARGELDAVLAVIKSLFCQYSVHGYGTAVSTLHFDPFNGAAFVGRIRRAASCD